MNHQNNLESKCQFLKFLTFEHGTKVEKACLKQGTCMYKKYDAIPVDNKIEMIPRCYYPQQQNRVELGDGR